VRKVALFLAAAALALVGCSGGDVTAGDVHDKEKQIEEATNKLNGGAPPVEPGTAQDQ
jgi:outer membrane lipoprotein SlyB